MAAEDEESARAERRVKLKKLNVELAQDGKWHKIIVLFGIFQVIQANYLSLLLHG